jgi:hypothetical protein
MQMHKDPTNRVGLVQSGVYHYLIERNLFPSDVDAQLLIEAKTIIISPMSMDGLSYALVYAAS